jgi:predicted dehydrogenase
MERVRCGVIGVGQLGQHHVRIYDQLPEAELVGIFDSDPARMAEISKRHSAKVFDSVESLIPEVDAVSLAVPTSLHHEIGMKVLAEGKHLLVEKPITSTVEEGRELVAAAGAKDLILGVGHSERFAAPIRTVLRYVEKPRFVLSMVDSDVDRVEAVGVPVFTRKVDIANARLSFSDGTVVTLTASRVSPERLRKVRFFQDDSYMSVDLLNKSVNILRRRVDFSSVANLSPHEVGVDELVEALNPPVEDREPLLLELLDFILSVRGEKKPEVTGEDGLRALVVATQIVEDIQSRLERWSR